MMYSPPNRTQCGYRYRNSKFGIVWVTSVPQTDEAAFEYFAMVKGWGKDVQYIEKRDAGQDEWRMLPKQFVNGEVIDV